MKPLAVIAHYNKDLSWTNELSKLGFDRLVYTKSEEFASNSGARIDCLVLKLPNVGREAHTYAYNIVERFYVNSDDQWTVYLQDDAPRHCQSCIGTLHTFSTLSDQSRIDACGEFISLSEKHTFKLTDNLPPVCRKMKAYPYEGTRSAEFDPAPSLCLAHYLEPIFNGEKLDLEKEYFFPGGAHFAVRQSAIKRAGIDIFKRIVKYTEHAQHPVEATAMERLWPLVFSERKNG